MYQLAVLDDPPLRTVIGSDAYQAIQTKLQTYTENYKKYELIANSTNVDEPADAKSG